MNEAPSKPDSTALRRALALSLAAALIAVAFTVALRPASGAPDFVRFLGRFHTLAIHLPIGVLLAVAAAEAFGLLVPRLRPRLDPALDLALPFLALTSVAAFSLGILLARGGGYPPGLILLHRSFTLAAVVGSAACLAAWALRRRSLYRGVLGLTLLLLTVGAHFGGEMTRGNGYLTRYAPRFLQPLLGGAPARESAPSEQAPEITAEPLVFSELVLPLLRQRCVECHGADQAKGGLRLDSFAALAKGGEHGPVIVAGRGGASSLVTRMTLPAGNDDRMPPEGKPAPGTDEIELVRWWIDRGATESTRVRDAVVPDGARTLLSRAATASTLPGVVDAKPIEPAPSATPSSAATAAPSSAPSASAGPRLMWRDVVAPLLAARCGSCHAGAKQKGKLRVDSIAALIAGGKGGPSIRPGDASGGTLLGRMHLPLEDDKHMPPTKEAQLDPLQVELIAWWIAQGASETDPASKMPARFAKAVAISAVASTPPTPPASSSSPAAEPPRLPPIDAPTALTGPVRVYAELITPILRKRCGECHLGANAMVGLRVDDYDKMVAEADIVPGKPDQSPLVKRMRMPLGSEDRMPPSDKPQPSAAEIEAVAGWIAGGASREQIVDAAALPRDLWGFVERRPNEGDRGPVAGGAPKGDAKAQPPPIKPVTVAPPPGKGCAACTIGGDQESALDGRSAAVAALLALALGARRARRRCLGRRADPAS